MTSLCARCRKVLSAFGPCGCAPPRPRAMIQVASGRLIDALQLAPSDIEIEDVAAALSRICRFGGHLKESIDHYSVAQHSVMVSLHCHPANALHGLLHDAHEAFFGDVLGPCRPLLSSRWRSAENGAQSAIGQRLGLGDRLVDEKTPQHRMPDDVKEADMRALATEKRDLLVPAAWDHISLPEPFPEEIHPLPPREARMLFLSRFHDLFDREGK